MPLFPEGQDPLDAQQGAAERAPMGQGAPDPFAPQPTAVDAIGAAFRQNNPIFSVLESVAAASPDQRRDPSYNPLTVLKGTPFEQDPSRFLDDPNESVTRARMTQAQREQNDRETLAGSGMAGTVAGLGAGLLDPSFYIPFVGEAREASFAARAARMAALGGAQVGASEAALQASQQTRSWQESAGNIATNTLLMGILGGALGHLSPAERTEATDALEGARRDSTPANPLDGSSMSVQDHITPGASGLSQGVEARAAELHAAGAAATPFEAAEAAHIEALPEDIAHEVDGGAAQESVRAAAERGGAGGEPDPQGLVGEPGSGWGSDGGGGLRPADAPAGDPAFVNGGDGLDPAGVTTATYARDPDLRTALNDLLKQHGVEPLSDTPIEKIPALLDQAVKEAPASQAGPPTVDLPNGRHVVIDGDLATIYDKPGGKSLGHVKTIGDGEKLLHVAPEARRQGVASDLYDAIERHTGAKQTPSDMLLADGHAFWRARDPAAIANYKSPPGEDFFVSPKGLKEYLDFEEPGSEEHAALQAMFDALPTEAKAGLGNVKEDARDRQQEMLAMMRRAGEPGQSGRGAGATEPQPDLTLRNPRTGAEVQAQAVAPLAEMLKRFDASKDMAAHPLARATRMVVGDRLAKTIGDMKVYTVGRAEMRALMDGRMKAAIAPGFEPAGFFDPRSGHIAVLDDAMRDPAEASRLLVHEGLHGAFMRTIDESPAARNVIDHLRTTAAAAHLERGGDLADHYGLTNAHEFVSEAFSNPEFQRFLASIPADDRMVQAFGLDQAPGNSLWDVFVGAVRKILGLAPDQHTLLDATMRVGKLLDEGRSVAGPALGDGSLAASLRPAGAAVADTRDLELKSFGGLEKVPGIGKLNAKLSPNLRVLSGVSTQAKRAIVGLADTALRFTQHDRGIATQEGGSLETRVRVDKAKFTVAGHEALEHAWIDHRYGDTTPSRVQRARDALGDLRGQTPAGKLSYKDFKAAVHDAMTAGDQHPVPQVAQAARDIRSKILDPIQRRAQQTLGPDGRPMLGEELSPPKGDASFVPRMWNHEAVIAKRFQLKDTIASWLGGEQATKAAAKDRIGGFVDDLNASSERLAGLAEDDPARAHEQATHDAIRGKIEKELGDWQGSSADEAKAAIKAREKAEAARQAKIDEDTYRGEGTRLTSADDAVDGATRRILASDRDLSRGELADRADEIIDRIIGSPDGRIPYDAVSGGPRIGYTGGPKNEVRGSLRSRDFAIPTALVKDFVHRDMEHVISSYLRTILPDIELTRRFGDVDMTDTFRRIQEEYGRMIGPETSEAQARDINARRDSDITDIAAVRDKLRGVYGWSPDPMSRKVGAIVRDFHAATSLASLGTSVANRLNDIGAQAVMRYGVANVFNDAWRPFFKSMLGMSPLAGIARQQAKEMGVGIDGLLGHLRHNLSDINDNYLPGNKFSRGLQWANDRSMLINLHGPWTDTMKAMAWMPAQAELGRLADRVAAGAATDKDLARLADMNIDQATAARISRQLEAHSITVDGVRLATAGEWTDRGARDAFERAMSREANINVITAGIGQKPNLLSKPLGGLIGQFKSFVAGAHESILLSNVQQRDGRTMQGMLVAMSMGMLSYRLYTLLSGQEASPRPQDWIKEGLARSALPGWFNEANNTLAKFTAGKVDYNRLYGADRPLTRRTENSPMSELLGPTYSQLEGLTGIVTHTLSGHASAADIHAGRHIVPLQNLMGARIGFDYAEDGIDNALGFKPRDHSPHEWAPGPTPYPQ